jgi:RNA ligase
MGDQLGWRIAKRHSFAAVSELLALAKTLPPTEEGFVLRFKDGLRLKVKGDEYCRIHRLVSRLTPLAMWEAMQAGDDLDAVRRQLPEEFWADFDTIIAILQKQIADLVAAVKAQAETVADLSDKDVGLRLDTFPAEVRRFIFPYRKSGGDLLSGRTRDLVFRTIRPDANRLEGYAPSSAMSRVFDEAA